MMSLQYISDKVGNPTAVQLQISIEDWELLKKKYKEFEDEEIAKAIELPDWHVELVKKELQDIKAGKAELMEWDQAVKTFKV